jgi:uncharacterized protein (DUF1810 family)
VCPALTRASGQSVQKHFVFAENSQCENQDGHCLGILRHAVVAADPALFVDPDRVLANFAPNKRCATWRSVRLTHFSAGSPAPARMQQIQPVFDEGMAAWFRLSRFVDAQERDVNEVQAELKSGHKSSHWIWYHLPQLKILGKSFMAREKYGITCRAEAEQYAAHPVLGARLEELSRILLAQPNRDPVRIFGTTDAVKTRSCMTLFDSVKPGSVYGEVLARLFDKKRCDITLDFLRPPNVSIWRGTLFEALQPAPAPGSHVVIPGSPLLEGPLSSHVTLSHGLLWPDNFVVALAEAKAQMEPENGKLTVRVMKSCDAELREECFQFGNNDQMLTEALAKCGLQVEGDLGTAATQVKATKEMVAQTMRMWGSLAKGSKAEKVDAVWRIAHCTLKKDSA